MILEEQKCFTLRRCLWPPYPWLQAVLLRAWPCVLRLGGYIKKNIHDKALESRAQAKHQGFQYGARTSRRGTPLPQCDTPTSRCGTLLGQCGTPLRQCGTPVVCVPACSWPGPSALRRGAQGEDPRLLAPRRARGDHAGGRGGAQGRPPGAPRVHTAPAAGPACRTPQPGTEGRAWGGEWKGRVGGQDILRQWEYRRRN